MHTPLTQARAVVVVVGGRVVVVVLEVVVVVPGPPPAGGGDDGCGPVVVGEPDLGRAVAVERRAGEVVVVTGGAGGDWPVAARYAPSSCSMRARLERMISSSSSARWAAIAARLFASRISSSAHRWLAAAIATPMARPMSAASSQRHDQTRAVSRTTATSVTQHSAEPLDLRAQLVVLDFQSVEFDGAHRVDRPVGAQQFVLAGR